MAGMFRMAAAAVRKVNTKRRLPNAPLATTATLRAIIPQSKNSVRWRLPSLHPNCDRKSSYVPTQAAADQTTTKIPSQPFPVVIITASAYPPKYKLGITKKAARIAPATPRKVPCELAIHGLFD
jgi:hypothetical protein